MNVTWLIGRITFVIGYPNYRPFGVALSFWPSMVASGYAMFKFVQEFELF